MNKKDNTYIAYLQNVVTNLPKTEEEKKKQKRYDILMAFLILSPIIFSSILMSFKYYLFGISYLILCWGLCVIIGVNKRKQINKKFYKIENAHTKFNLINVDDENTIKELYKDSALTFIAEPSNDLLDFIFNWLNNENVIKSESLNLYVFNGHMLRQAFDYSRYDDDIKFLSIFLKDLDLNDSNMDSFSKSHFLVGSRWLDDIVDNDKN